MITGFNTDIEHAGVVYHVQTEDKGLNSPLILSLVYIGGTIIANKRTPYEDLVADGYDENVLTERLQRQHKLMCAAIKAGRIEDLKRLGQRDRVDAQPSATPSSVSDVETQEAKKAEVGSVALQANKIDEESLVPTAPLEMPKPLQEPVSAGASESLTSLLDELKSLERRSPLLASPDAGDKRRLQATTVESEQDGLILSLRHETELRAGTNATLLLSVYRGDEELRVPLANAPIVVKILGTTFRPVILKTETDADGRVVVQMKIPTFTSGRAALLIESTVEGDEVALRRIIRA